jgi:hypothetical protein
VTLRYRYGGGRPPASLEVLLIGEDGTASYVAGNPWPKQPPFDEIGAYRGSVDNARLEKLARAVIGAGGSGSPWPADSGVEAVELDGASAGWDPEEPPGPAAAFVREARAAIVDVRESPVAAARAELIDAAVRLTNRGSEALQLETGAIHLERREEVHAPSPLRLGRRPALELELPGSLPPGETLVRPVELPAGEGNLITGLVHVRWTPPFDVGEGDGPLDGWILLQPLDLGS